MTDLEEEILFQLITCNHKGLLMLSEEVSTKMKNNVPLGIFHETILKLVEKGLIQPVRVKMRRNYSITEAGSEALQQEWRYYKNNYSA